VKPNTIRFQGRIIDVEEVIEASHWRIDAAVARPLIEAILAHLNSNGGRGDVLTTLTSLRHQVGVAIEAMFPGELAARKAERAASAEAAIRRERAIPAAIKKQVMERDAYRCRRCDGHADLTIDHITPIKNGGKTVAENLQVLCRGCNSKKGAWHPMPHPHA
jgi:hypothetical protein